MNVLLDDDATSHLQQILGVYHLYPSVGSILAFSKQDLSIEKKTTTLMLVLYLWTRPYHKVTKETKRKLNNLIVLYMGLQTMYA